MLFAPVQQLSQIFDGYQQAAVALRRIGGLLRTPTSTPAAPRPRPCPRGPARIELRGVRFSYGPGSPELVGRFYDVTAGSVLVDGTGIRDRIVVLDGGRIAEIGSHDDLPAAGGGYASLWAAFTGDGEPAA